MADILIRGMAKMPKSCEDCPLVEETENYYGDTMSRECNLIYKGYISEAPKGGRLQGCPLVSLPEGHGRLIDADALLNNNGVGTQIAGWGKMFHETAIAYAPTIVPSEGGEEDGQTMETIPAGI